MAIVLEANYAKKLGLPGYSSHQYSVSIRTELTDLSQVQTESGRLYRLLQDAVDREIQEVGFMPEPSTYGNRERRSHSRTLAGNGHRSGSPAVRNRPLSSQSSQRTDYSQWNCSDKQKAFIQQLVSEASLDKNHVEQLAQAMFGAGVRQLDRLQASGLIDELIRRHGRGHRADPSANGGANGSSHPQRGPPCRAGPLGGHTRRWRRGWPRMNAPTPPQVAKARTKEELLQTISASRLGTWLSCRLKFFFRYMSGLPKAPSAAMHVGSVLHAVLQQWNLARWRRAPLEGEMIRTVFDQAWTEKQAGSSIRWDDPETEVKAGALALLETYLRETPIPLEERPEGVEVAVDMDLGRYGLPTLVGILDLVRSGGKIVDYKSTARTPDAEKVLHTTEIQTTAYALLYREATDRQESGIELHHLVRLKTPKLVVTQVGPASPQQFDRLFRLIESYVQGLAAEDFVPSPGLQCSSCEFFNECRKWP